MKTEVDVLIIGAGPAGSSAAALLHRQGFKLLVVEKQIFPRFVIGESLLPHSMDLLKEADLLDAVESQNFIQKCGAVFLRGDETCNFDFSNQFTAGWKYTFQVPRADFDKTLADAVAARGVEILFGHGVTAISFNENGATATIESPDKTNRSVTAKFILDCSGYGRVLPRLLDLETPSRFPPREALLAHVTGDQRPAGREEGKIWACIHPAGAWIWIIPFSNGKTSVGVVGSPEFFTRFPGEPEEKLRAILSSDPNAATAFGKNENCFRPAKNFRLRLCGEKTFWPAICARRQCHGISRPDFQFRRHAGARVGEPRRQNHHAPVARRNRGLAGGLRRPRHAGHQHVSRLRFRVV